MSKNPYRYYSLGAWGGLLMLPATIIFWGIMGQNIPPYSAGLSAEELAAQLIANADSIRIGMIVQLLVSAFYFYWGLITAKVLQEVEEDNNVLSALVLWGAAYTMVVFMVGCSVWLTCVFRPEVMDPQILQMFFDFGWFFFDNTFTPTSMGMIAMGVGFLRDRREVPLFPRWVCWMAICVAIGFIFVALMPLFKVGPFSRSGSINYWVEFGIFFAYWAATAGALVRAVNMLNREHRQDASAA